ncbi:hypothetical protein ABIB25_000758 [Nakamurella sp. UYEF19]|uniref:hypothetical protein n=1 Tax=Nakamurella sp. UYEF19 TaxID=1756392 RepID=UPI003392E480
MGRRMGGMLLLVTALIALVVVAGLQRPNATGTAVPQDVPAPPTVGACLPSAPPGEPDQYPPSQLLPAATFGPCAELHYGEVAQVLSHRPAVANEIVGGDERTYIGLPTSIEESNWVSPINTSIVWANPTALQQAAGQQWVACIVTPGSSTPYRGTVGQALNTGRLPAVYSSCLAGTDPHTPLVPCSSPHRSEVLGQASPRLIAGGQAHLDAMCMTYAKTLTRRADFEADGQLRARSLSEHFGPSPTDSLAGLDPDYPSSNNSQSTCIVSATGSRLLTASLLGIGDGPLPLG